MSRQRIVSVLVASAVAIAACGDDDDGVAAARADQLRSVAREAGLGDDVADFFALAGRGLVATYQVVYEQDGVTVTVTQRPPERRVDVADPDGSVRSQIETGGEGHTCTAPASGPAECERSDASVRPAGVFAVGALERALAELAGAAERFDFALETRDVAGTLATCLVTEPVAGSDVSTGTLCLSGEGAVVLLADGDERLTASGYTTDIPAGIFELPD